MKMLEIIALENGAHRNQSYHGVLPEGWAIVPEDIEPLESFPFGEVEAAEIDGVMTVTKWMPGEVPAEPEQKPSQFDVLEAQVTYTAMMTNTLLEV